MAKTVLVVDDDPTQRRLAQAVLEREGYAVVHAESGGEAIDRLTKGGGADVVLLDMVMPGMSGMEALAEIRTAGVTTPVIVLTASGGVDAVVKAMQAGAQDFFVKPVSAERLLVGVSNALQLTRLTAEVGRPKKHVSGRTSFDDLVGTSPPMRMVKSLGARAAKSSIPVLITGESGVGKEVIARALHGASDRSGKPFVAVNCGALPANLIESILFGHEKGAFTGAHDKHLGKFRRPTAAPCSSTRSANCRWTCRSSCCAPCRRVRSTRSAPNARSRSTSASSRPPTATRPSRSAPAPSARICSTVSTSSRSRLRPCASAARTFRP